jgi:hypothetical protein
LAVLLAVAAGAVVRRILLGVNFGVSVPLFYSLGPVLAAAVGTAGAMLILNLPMAAPGWGLHAAALAVGLAAYAASLKAWLVMTGDHLQLVKFTTE